MARPKYKITKEDLYYVMQWVDGQRHEFLGGRMFPTGESVSAFDARKEYDEIVNSRRSPEAVNAWAEKWLKKEQWTQLKNAVRAQRKRGKEMGGETRRSITLDSDAWLILSDLAKRDGVTLSQCIRNRLHEAWVEGLLPGRDQGQPE